MVVSLVVVPILERPMVVSLVVVAMSERPVMAVADAAYSEAPNGLSLGDAAVSDDGPNELWETGLKKPYVHRAVSYSPADSHNARSLVAAYHRCGVEVFCKGKQRLKVQVQAKRQFEADCLLVTA